VIVDIQEVGKVFRIFVRHLTISETIKTRASDPRKTYVALEVHPKSNLLIKEMTNDDFE
jgi:hypothetical protein